MRSELSFDGFGINGPDEYRTRIATFYGDSGTKYGALFLAAPEMLEILETVLTRLDLEADEKGPGASFPCAAMRDDIRLVIEKAKGLRPDQD